MEQHNETPHREEKGETVSVVVILSSHTQWSGYKHREGASDLEKTSEKGTRKPRVSARERCYRLAVGFKLLKEERRAAWG